MANWASPTVYPSNWSSLSEELGEREPNSTFHEEWEAKQRITKKDNESKARDEGSTEEFGKICDCIASAGRIHAECLQLNVGPQKL